MKLRTKILWIILILWGIFFSTTYLLGRHILTKSYLQLEQQQGFNNLDQVMDTLDRLHEEVAQMVAFWSIFDDAYFFMADKNKAYIDGTITVWTLGKDDIDMMIYFNEQGKFFYGIAVNRKITKEVPIPAALFKYLEPKGVILNQPNLDSHYKGIVAIPEGILLIASHAIVKSDGTGPVRGTQVMARYLTKDEVKKIAKITHLDLAMYRIDEINDNPRLKSIYQDLFKAKDNKLLSVDMKASILWGYLLLRDINNKPIAIIEAAIPRDIYASGIKTINYFNFIFLVFGAIFLFILAYLLRQMLTSRLEKLSESIVNIGKNPQQALRVNVEGSDEITSVEKETNKMLETIDDYSKTQANLLAQVSSELDKANAFSKKIQATEVLLRDAINFMPSMLIIVNQEFNITKINSMALHFLQLSQDEINGKNIYDYFPYLKNYENKLISAKESKRADVIDKIIYVNNNVTYYYQVIIYPLSYLEKEQCLAIRIDEISEKIKLEEQLWQHDKLSSIGILAAGIANEIIDPVNTIKLKLPLIFQKVQAIIGLLHQCDQVKEVKEIQEVMKNINLENTHETIDQLLAEIKSNADKTDSTVKNLQLFVRMNEEVPKKYNVEQGLDATIKLLKYRCGDRITIVKNYSKVPEVIAIPGLLNQVFMNIINNAIDAIKQEGTITINTAIEADRVMITIKDTGIGISAEHKDKIFKPFFTTKLSEGASGLGLSISQEIISQHQGEIILNTNLTQGAEFTIILPVTPF